MPSLQRLTIRDKEEVLLIKKAIKLLLDTSSDKLPIPQQMRAISIYHKTQRAINTHG